MTGRSPLPIGLGLVGAVLVALALTSACLPQPALALPLAGEGVVNLTAAREPLVVHNVTAGWAEDPRVALSRDFVFVSYSVTAGEGSQVYLTRLSRKNLAGPGETVRLDRNGEIEFDPSMAIASDGAVWVAWTSLRKGAWSVRAARIEGITPGEEMTISLPGDFHSGISVAAGRGLVCFTWVQAVGDRWRVMARCFDGKLEPAFQVCEGRPGYPLGRPVAAVAGGSGDSLVFAWDQYDGGKWSVVEVVADKYGFSGGEPVCAGCAEASYNWEASLAGGSDGLVTAWSSVPADSIRCQPVVAFRGSPASPSAPIDVGLRVGSKENWRVKCFDDGAGAWVAWTTRLFYRNTDLYLRRIGPAGMSRACKIGFPVRKTFMNVFDCRMDGSFYVAWDQSGSIYLGEVTQREISGTGVTEDSLKQRDAWAAAPSGTGTTTVSASEEAEPPAAGAGESEEVAPPLAGRSLTRSTAAPASRPYSVFYEGESLHVYLGDCHNHTSFSDGRAYPDISLEIARDRRRLDFAAVTDHDVTVTPGEFAWSAAVASALTRTGSFAALDGFEASKGWAQAGFGHWTALFPRGGRVLHFAEGMTPPSLYGFAREAGALVIPHHVAKKFAPHDWAYFDPVAEAVVEICSLHGIFESGVGNEDKRDMVPGRYVEDALGRGYVFGFVGGSDSHNAFGSAFQEEGFAGVYAPSLEPGEVFRAMERRRTFALTGGRIVVDFRCNGRLMGEEMEAPASAPLAFTGYACSPDSIVSLEIVSAGAVVARADSRAPEARIQWDAAPGGSRQYYYLRVRTAMGDLAWSSPIWIAPQQSPK